MGCNTSQQHTPLEAIASDINKDENIQFAEENKEENSQSLQADGLILNENENYVENISELNENQYSEEKTNGKNTRNEQSERSDETELQEAATKIQAIYRGHKVRSDVNKVKQCNESTNTKTDLPISGIYEIKESQENHIEFNPDDEELYVAASKIQTAYRGHLQKKRVDECNAKNGIKEFDNKVIS